MLYGVSVKMACPDNMLICPKIIRKLRFRFLS